MKSPLQVLSEVRDLFKDRSKWTRGANARDQSGKPVEPSDPTAVCWCINGGIELKAGGYGPNTSYYGTFDLLHSLEATPITVNDCEGYDAVMGLLDKAIAHVSL